MRLTYDKNGTEPKIYDCDFLDNSKCIQKLGQLEDIEEELGIDLVILFKALKNGIYISKNDKRFVPIILCHADLTLELEIGYQDYVSVKDYGKTWALTREELEK